MTEDYTEIKQVASQDTLDSEMMESADSLRVMIDLRNSIQKTRIATNNRIKAHRKTSEEDGVDDGYYIKTLDGFLEQFLDIESNLDLNIRMVSERYEIVERMSDIKGVGQLLAAQVVCMIDIRRADTVSALWRYAGYAVMDGEREKLTKGEKAHYNTRLKSICYKVSNSMLRCGSPYTKIYYDAKAYYEANRTDWTKLHIHNASIRKMTKLWLSHLWEVWRKLEGLEVRELYVMEKLGHKHLIKPSEYGWREI